MEDLLMTAYILMTNPVKKDLCAATVLTRTEPAKAVANAFHPVIIMLNIPALSSLNLHMCAMAAKIRISAALKRSFTEQRKLKIDTGKFYLNQDPDLT